ncbi:MAG: MbnP family protein [Saprospiraceae bacterium]
MKIQALCLSVLLLIGLNSCKKDTGGTLTLHFKAFYDGQSLRMFDTKPFTNPEQVQFTHLSFMVSDLQLLDQSAKVNLKDVELVDLSFDDANSADGGYTITIDNLPAKSYSGLSFGIGVPADMNSKKPADYPSSSPLSNSSYYWVAWDSFIFMKTEGRIDTIGNGSFDTGFAFHTGTDNLYRIVMANIPILIEDGKNKNIDIDLDYKKVLDGIDIKSNPQNHNPKDSLQIKVLVQNLSDALTLVQ